MSVRLAMNEPPIEPEALARKTLDGKPATNKDFALRVANLMLGNPTHGLEPLKTKEIMKKLGYKDKKSIRLFKELAIYLNYIEMDGGKPKLPKKSITTQFRDFNEKHPFTTDERVAKWQDNLLVRNHGEPITTWRQYVRGFEAVCNTLRVNPEQFVTGNNILDVLQQGRVYMEEFIKKYKNGEAKIQYDKDWAIDKVDIAHIAYQYSKYVRDFMKFWGYPYAKGETGVMSQNIRSFHGKYADILLSTEEFDKGKKYIKEKWGIETDIFRCYTFGRDSCARRGAITETMLNYKTHTSKKTGKTTFIMEVYESKTKQIKGGIWKKYIVDNDLQESVKKAAEKGQTYLLENRDKKSMDELASQLREVYTHLGKKTVHLKNRSDPESGYFMAKPFHALRHIGAHYWLKKKKYNYGLVAKIGGWNTIDELKDSYGEMPPEVVLELLEDEEQVGGLD